MLEDEFPHMRQRFSIPVAVIKHDFKDYFEFTDLKMICIIQSF
ncbi:hypothetical protein EV13_0912 [Prochlorococcus sp. MIT 0702]|nr:hypothetical protein EV12_0467 [Prochlorococcus sp. MIT 0701]KGG29695.1 hypothetical protein EV13_0912 [Prochlorococcus sp. MIT 0702]KGG34249.1 hypothetical protein EV14_1343 [Prochlorococcus sp. MIT 0703]